jgi:hypothetical protein
MEGRRVSLNHARTFPSKSLREQFFPQSLLVSRQATSTDQNIYSETDQNIYSNIRFEGYLFVTFKILFRNWLPVCTNILKR